jgi:hypothetical protein
VSFSAGKHNVVKEGPPPVEGIEFAPGALHEAREMARASCPNIPRGVPRG